MNCFNFGPEPEKKKCVICVVNMWSSERNTNDKVNYYIYDKKKKKKKYAAAAAAAKMSRPDPVEYVEPISSTNYCRLMASYITYGSHLFRIGGQLCSYQDFLSSGPASVSLMTPEFMLKRNRSCYAETLATRTVDIIDLKSEDDMMLATKGPEMKAARHMPHLLILQGNLYVAGGLLSELYYNTNIEDVVFMEVLNKSAAATADWFWEPVPNPPPFCVSSDCELPNDEIMTGAVESIGVIMVAIGVRGEYCLYTYQPTTTRWEVCTTYSNTILYQDLKSLMRRPAVVSGKFMLWLWFAGDSAYSTLLYVMDLENDKLISIDLYEEKLLPHPENLPFMGCTPILLKLKEGKFCVFWVECDDPKFSSGPHTYAGLHASIFTLKKGTGKEEGALHVKLKKRYFSLIPDWRTHNLAGVCIADIPDSKRHKKQRWTPFCRSDE